MTNTFVPAEWQPHRVMWVGFPSHAELWQEDLEEAQAEVAALAVALAEQGGERVRLLACGEAAIAQARALAGEACTVTPGTFGDIWLRDTGPIFFADHAAAFRFNGWGGKYVLAGDDTVAIQLAAHAGTALRTHPFILEGGAIEHDGAGTVLTTRQCLLNDNRNGWTEAQAQTALAEALGARNVLWLDDGLLNDHTDGHIDNLARFIAPGLVACPVATGGDDPNAALYERTASALAAMTDADGRLLQVVRIPSPGLTVDADGEIVPASHMNFLIADKAVIVPIYDEAAGAQAVEALRPLFPGREVTGLSSRAILTGGGSFHCISQQEPA